ncbi:hypothetical protein J6590_016672 [Homalodisca vitripennis]|nr:hypothetical protein J6590_016672 [Homalodisca vitripennis]
MTYISQTIGSSSRFYVGSTSVSPVHRTSLRRFVHLLHCSQRVTSILASRKGGQTDTRVGVPLRLPPPPRCPGNLHRCVCLPGSTRKSSVTAAVVSGNGTPLSDVTKAQVPADPEPHQSDFVLADQIQSTERNSLKINNESESAKNVVRKNLREGGSTTDIFPQWIESPLADYGRGINVHTRFYRGSFALKLTARNARLLCNVVSVIIFTVVLRLASSHVLCCGGGESYVCKQQLTGAQCAVYVSCKLFQLVLYTSAFVISGVHECVIKVCRTDKQDWRFATVVG